MAIIPVYVATKEVTSERMYFDAVVNLVPTFSGSLTKYPVSSKSQISNHFVKSNPTLEITAYVGRYPLKDYQDSIISTNNRNTRPQRYLELLLKWFNSGTELFINSEYITFNGYVITSLRPYTEGSNDSLRIDLTFEKARRVTYKRGILIEFMDNVKTLDAKGTDVKGRDSKEDNRRLTEKVFDFYFKEDTTTGETQ